MEKAAVLTSPWKDSTGPDPSLPGGYMNYSPARSMKLFDMEKLEIPKESQALFKDINIKVRAYMYRDMYDPSHDYEHIQRVVKIAQDIYRRELKKNKSWAATLDPFVIYLGCMLHDVGDRKYLAEGQTQEHVVADLLLKC